MNCRKLRIAWSVGWGILCLLLILLWGRSYWRRDFYQGHWLERDTTMWSNYGELKIARMRVFSVPFSTHGGSHPAKPPEQVSAAPQHRLLGVNWSVYDGGWSVGVSVALPLLCCVIVGSAPWLLWHFSLRTLLIAIALVAVGLGMVVWATK